MAERTTARDRLERVLYLLPAAAREGGASLEELAGTLDVTEKDVLDDVTELTAREYYHPAGSGGELQIGVERGRLSVWTTGDFRRPVRLSPREALALGLALRVRAAEAEPERRRELLALAGRLEAALAVTPVEEVLPHYALEDGAGAEDGLPALLRDAIADRRRCRIRYLKPGGEAPEERVICPYTLAFAEGFWYVIGHCTTAGAVRIFRLDRVLEAHPADGTFRVPDDFDPDDYVDGGRLFRADEEVEVAVRYSPRIARWLAEREAHEPRDDGSIVVRHRVADPRWLVRHVLQYGPDAEVLEPAELRELVAASVRPLSPSETSPTTPAPATPSRGR